MNNLNVCFAHSYLYPHSRFKQIILLLYTLPKEHKRKAKFDIRHYHFNLSEVMPQYSGHSTLFQVEGDNPKVEGQELIYSSTVSSKRTLSQWKIC